MFHYPTECDPAISYGPLIAGGKLNLRSRHEGRARPRYNSALILSDGSKSLANTIATMPPLKEQTLEKEFEKNPEIQKKDIQHLREWMEKQPHLPNVSDLVLLTMLHSCEFSMEATKRCVDLNLTTRTHFDQFFTNRDPTSERAEFTFSRVLYAALPTPTPEGYRVVYCRLTDYDPKNYNFIDSIKNFMYVLDLWQYEEGTWPGFVLSIDLDGISLGHLARLDIMGIRQTLYFLQEALPVRLTSFHFLNTPPFMDKLMMLLKPFMKKELMSILHLHPPPADTIYKFIPRKSLPKECGGEFDDFKTIQENLRIRLRDNRQIIIDEEKDRVNEALRPGKPKNLDSLFGLEGSFKKLEID